MLKRILGTAPFDVLLKNEVVVSASGKTVATLCFENESEYDLPLSCVLKLQPFVNADKTQFDVTLPAEGNTSIDIVFSIPEDAKIVGGKKICELEIIDRIFDSKTLYEFEICVEMAYKCCDKKENSFMPSDDVLYSRDGVFYGNCTEKVCLELALIEEQRTEIHVIAGKIKQTDTKLCLSQGVNKIEIEFSEDGSFEFINCQDRRKMFFDTINPKYFI